MICRIFASLFAVVYLGALGVMIIGVYGLFGVQPGPLSAVYLLMLGAPWTGLMMPLLESLGDTATIALLAVAPLINLAAIYAICRLWCRLKSVVKSKLKS